MDRKYKVLKKALSDDEKGTALVLLSSYVVVKVDDVLTLKSELTVRAPRDNGCCGHDVSLYGQVMVRFVSPFESQSGVLRRASDLVHMWRGKTSCSQ